MYQAWLVQKFGNTPYNIILGDKFKTVEEAFEMIELYEQVFGKCESGKIEPAGTPIPHGEKEKESLWQTVKKFF